MPPKSKVQRAEELRVKDYRQTFSGDSGERVLRDLMQFGMFSTVHVPGDPHSTAFGEGQRNMVLYIITQLGQSDPLWMARQGLLQGLDYNPEEHEGAPR